MYFIFTLLVVILIENNVGSNDMIRLNKIQCFFLLFKLSNNKRKSTEQKKQKKKEKYVAVCLVVCFSHFLQRFLARFQSRMNQTRLKNEV